MRHAISLAMVLCLAVSAMAGPGKDGGTSERYAEAAYREKRGRLTVLVGSYHAGMQQDSAYVPVLVAIGLRGKGPSIVFAPESFKLIDSEGNVYEAARYGELVERYDKIEFDAWMIQGKPLPVGQQFTTSVRLGTYFYPPLGDGPPIARAPLSSGTWFADVVYFPRPVGGLGGVLTLRVQGDPLHEPVEVRFRCPEPPAKKKKR